jgi:Subtilase family
VNETYPPLNLAAPQTADRRPEKPRLVPLSAEIILRRAQIAARLRSQIEPIARRLADLSEEERRAVFVKLQHEGTVPLSGTGLKPITEPTEQFTLALVRENNLDRLSTKLDAFATGPEKKGMVPNAELGRIQSIEEGQPFDRLSEKLFTAYVDLVRQDWIICEIEMISVAQGSKQKLKELAGIRDALMQAFRNGTSGNLFEHEEIKGTIRAVIRCTGELFRELVEGAYWQTRIVWFEERPLFETLHQTIQAFDFSELGPIDPPPAVAPTVCVIDTGVTAGNPFLSPIVIEGQLRSFLKQDPTNPSDAFGHGSGVASLVGYYALNLAQGASNQAKVWIAAARILDGQNKLEDERLFSSLLREVVAYFAPMGIRVFNLSVNDFALGWNQSAKRTVPRRSWTARTIDQLSRKWDVVFVVSTGNLSAPEINEFISSERHYPSYLSDEDASIHDPGQSALAMTIGSIAHSTLIAGPDGRTRAMAELDHPSPFTRTGPGIRGEIKPELVEYGGNYAFDEQLHRAKDNPGLKVPVASHQLSPAIAYDIGSSFAAARVSHKLALILHDLQSLGIQPSSCLLKAFLVNSARCPISDELDRFQESLSSADGYQWLHVLGYGVPDHQRATDCDEHSALMFFQGTLQPDTVAFFDIPVPASLEEADRGRKRLTVTVVMLPEVQRWGLEEYLGTTFKWRMFRGDIPREQIVARMAEGEDEGVEEEAEGAPSELKFEFGILRRSRGAIQHDVSEWTLHRSEYSANHYTLAIAAYERWGRENPDSVPFAVIVRLEDDSQSAQVYSEVRAALAALQVPARASSSA